MELLGITTVEETKLMFIKVKVDNETITLVKAPADKRSVNEFIKAECAIRKVPPRLMAEN